MERQRERWAQKKEKQILVGEKEGLKMQEFRNLSQESRMEWEIVIVADKRSIKTLSQLFVSNHFTV